MTNANTIKNIPIRLDGKYDAKQYHVPLIYKPIWTIVGALCLGLGANSAFAGERESLEQLRSTTVNLVNLLVEEGVLSKGKADELLKQASQEAAKSKEQEDSENLALDNMASDNTKAVDKAVEEKMVRVQYVPEIVKKEMREQIKNEVMAKLNYKAGERLGLPEWIDRFTFEGDIRLRYQNDRFGENNPNPLDFNIANGGTTLRNTAENRDSARVRARLGATVKVNDWMTGGIRMTTGELNDPTSPNQTQETASAKYTFSLDRAYLDMQVAPWLNFVGGRFENPFFSTDLVFDPDLAFDGGVLNLKPTLNDNWSGFVTAGIFPLDDIESSDINKAKSKWLYGSQAGIKWTSANRSSIKLGVALYEFDNVEGITNGTDLLAPYDGTIPVYRTKGNSVFDIDRALGPSNKFALLSKFRNVNVTGEIDLATFDPVHLVLTGDYTRNIGYDEQEIAKRIGVASITEFGFDKKQVDAYQVRLALGHLTTEKAHDWQVFTAYKYLEADSVLDSYTDSDFYQGGTNAKGWTVGASYGIAKNTWITARWFSADEIKPRVASGDPLSLDVLLLDLNARF